VSKGTGLPSSQSSTGSTRARGSAGAGTAPALAFVGRAKADQELGGYSCAPVIRVVNRVF